MATLNTIVIEGLSFHVKLRVFCFFTVISRNNVANLPAKNDAAKYSELYLRIILHVNVLGVFCNKLMTSEPRIRQIS